MIQWLYVPIILFLYLRTYKYCPLIDDDVPRGGYLYVNPTQEERPHYSFYDKPRSKMATITNIGHFLATCFAIHMTFGWKVALLYSLFPLNVSGVAWITGNYYMATALLQVIAYYFSVNFAIYGIILGVIFYVACLGTTVAAIPYAFLAPIITHNWMNLAYLVPLGFYIFGKRFQYGLKHRIEKHKDLHIEAGKFKFNRFFRMVKILGYYIALSILPIKFGFWHDYLKDQDERGALDKPTRLFWLNLILIIVFFVFGMIYNPKACLWWFFSIGVFSQFVTFGMTIAERYTFVANIGFCWIVATLLQPYPYLLTILCSLWFCKCLEYIPAFKNKKALFMYSANNQPFAPENYNALGVYWKERGIYIKGAEYFLMAVKYAGETSYQVMANLADCYSRASSYQRAVHWGLKALAVAPESKKELMTKFLDANTEKLNTILRQQKRLRRDGII